MRSRCTTSREDKRRLSVRLRPDAWVSRRTSFGFARNGKRITMPITLRFNRDRAGHTAVAAACMLLLGGASVATAAPDKYKAQRFDVTARALNGDLDVTESITFE